MNNYKTSLLPALVVATAAACAPAAGGPPEIIVDHTACAHCSMLISEPRYAAAYRVDGIDSTFDDIGCLLAALEGEPRSDDARVWFRDVHDDAWIEPPAATFVRSAALRTPMAGGIVATMHEAEVERLKAAHEATVYLSFAALLAERAASAGAAPAGRNP